MTEWRVSFQRLREFSERLRGRGSFERMVREIGTKVWVHNLMFGLSSALSSAHFAD